jgi:hypothetical protein
LSVRARIGLCRCPAGSPTVVLTIIVLDAVFLSS